MLCRLELHEQVNAAQSESNERMDQLYDKGVDAIVFLDNDGVITAGNEAFLKLTDSTYLANVRGRSLSDFLARGSVDLRVILDNAKRSRQLRLYSTKILNEFNGQISVEISATWFNDNPRPGFGLILRDSSRAELLRCKSACKSDQLTGWNSVQN